MSRNKQRRGHRGNRKRKVKIFGKKDQKLPDDIQQIIDTYKSLDSSDIATGTLLSMVADTCNVESYDVALVVAEHLGT